MFERIQLRYNKGWITLSQLHRYVELGVLTPAEYKTICDEDYVA